MIPWNDPYKDVDTINHDHNYFFSQKQIKNLSRKYFFKSYSLCPDNNDELDVEESGQIEFRENFLESLVAHLLDNVLIDHVDKSLDELNSYFTKDSEKPLLYSKNDYTVSEMSLRCKLYEILEKGVNSILICPPVKNEQYIINFQNLMKNISKKICRLFSACHWRMDICSLAHCSILEYAPKTHSCVYIEAFRLLHHRNKFKTILSQLHIWAQNQKITTVINWNNFLDYMKQEIPCYLSTDNDEYKISQLRDLNSVLKLEIDEKLRPTIIHIHPERWSSSKRMNGIMDMMKIFANVIEFKFDDSGRLRKKFEALRTLLLNELKSKKSPIFVMGWDLGSLLAMLSSVKLQHNSQPINHHGTYNSVLCGIIAIGVPIKGLKGERGVIPEDYIHLLSHDTLIVSGDLSRTGNGDDIEDFKDRLLLQQNEQDSAINDEQPYNKRRKTSTSASNTPETDVNIRCVTMGGCDEILRLSNTYAIRYQILNQDIVDVQIMKEVKRFVTDRIKDIYMNNTHCHSSIFYNRPHKQSYSSFRLQYSRGNMSQDTSSGNSSNDVIDSHMNVTPSHSLLGATTGSIVNNSARYYSNAQPSHYFS